MINRISELIIKHFNGELTVAEQAELNAWVARSEKEKNFFEQLTDKDYVSRELQIFYGYDEEKGWEKLKAQYPISNTPVISLAKRTWLRYAAAAVIIIMLGVGSYFTFFNKPSQPDIVEIDPQEKRYKNDIAPGKEGAILTLEDGTQIILDTAENGPIASQKHMVISKKDGELSYLDIGDSQLSPVLNTMTTPRGRQYSLVLADGSKVWLNAETSITYPTVFTGSERKVIINGEAYFEIAHNADMPFIVEKGNIKVEVLGTHFNVNAYDDEIMIRTTLLEGSVRIYGTANQTSAKILKPGQQALINSGKDINVVNADLDEVMAWKNGYFHFSKSSIESIMRQVSRWYDVDIDYEGKTTQLFKGEVPRSVNVSTLLKILESTGWVHFRIDGKKITVMQ